MNGPALLAFLAIAAGALAWHSVTEHHSHLRLLRVVRPKTVVPPTRHDTRWHAMGHWKRLGVNIIMLAVAIITGLAWQLSSGVTAALLIILAAGALVIGIVQAVSHAISGRMARHAGNPASTTTERDRT